LRGIASGWPSLGGAVASDDEHERARHTAGLLHSQAERRAAVRRLAVRSAFPGETTVGVGVDVNVEVQFVLMSGF
jgi:hypothetical protein